MLVCMLCMHEWICMRLIWQYNGKTIETNMDRSESGPASQYKYLVTLNGDNITGEDSNIVGVKPYNQNIAGVRPNRPKLEQKSPFLNWTKIPFKFSLQIVIAFLLCVFFLFETPNFCLNCPFGFSIHREYIFSFACPLFLPGSPFQVFNPPGRSFLPKPPFRVFSLASFFFSFFFLFIFYFLAMTTSILLEMSTLEATVDTYFLWYMNLK